MAAQHPNNTAESLNSLSFGVIIPAAGKGERMGGDTPKVLIDIYGRSVIQRVLDTMGGLGFVKEIVIAAGPEHIDRIRDAVLYDESLFRLHVTEGGDRRQDSVSLAFAKLAPCDYVIIHDGARPFVRAEDICSTAHAAVNCGAAILGVRPKATIKECGKEGDIEKTLCRDNLLEVQTPQIFEYNLFKKSLDHVREHDIEVTDDAQMVEEGGGRVSAVLGVYSNIKITTPEDIALAKVICKG